MSERIEEIRARTENALAVTDSMAGSKWSLHYCDDVPYLLSRIDELERENERPRRECINWQEMAHSPIPDE